MRETVGKISSELLQKTPDSRDPIEIQREVHKSYEQQLFDCIERSKKMFPDDFYVIVLTKKERLMKNVLRNYFSSRISCPTPDYDQVVYAFTRKEDKLEFLWVVPSKDTCSLLRDHAIEIHPDERDLLNFVLQFYDGTLLTIAKKRNGEL